MLQPFFEILTAGAVGVGAILGQFQTLTEPEWTLIATSDIIPARSVNFQMTKRNDFNWPIRDIASLLKSADITLINLESPLIPHCPLTNSGMTFCGDQRFAAALQTAGVDVANLANNHVLNYGWEGVGETEQILQSHGIETTGLTTEGQCTNQSYFCSK